MMANAQNIRDLRQWLCWRSETREGKSTKIPYSPYTSVRASSTDPETWGSYEEAVAACKKHGYSGIGVVFTLEDDLCGVDLDGCVDPETGEIERWAREIIDELDSYSEISPSGTGVHVLIRGTLPPGRNRKGRFEAYDRGRYFTVTERHLAGTPQSIESRQEQLERVVERVFGGSAAQSEKNGHSTNGSALTPTGLTDEELVRKASSASNGGRFARLWSGDTSGYGSHSEADLALCGMLAFWTGGDSTRVDTLFRRSGLYRQKWERESYREKTISEALRGKTEFYAPPKTVALAEDTRVFADEAEAAEEKEEKPTQAQLLVRRAEGAELFHTPSGEAYASVPVGDHRETHQVKSKGFRRWLVRAFFERYDRPPGAQALQDALGLLEARAQFDGMEREVFVRVAGHEGTIYVDLANERWEVVEIMPSGWRVMPANRAPVRFRRSRGMLALPTPRSGDGGDDLDDLLRRFINVSDEGSIRLIIAWLVQAFRPVGPYPVLIFQGEQGSAKSTAARFRGAPTPAGPLPFLRLYLITSNSICI